MPLFLLCSNIGSVRNIADQNHGLPDTRARRSGLSGYVLIYQHVHGYGADLRQNCRRMSAIHFLRQSINQSMESSPGFAFDSAPCCWRETHISPTSPGLRAPRAPSALQLLHADFGSDGDNYGQPPAVGTGCKAARLTTNLC
jgi:hypothetical protein